MEWGKKGRQQRQLERKVAEGEVAEETETEQE